MRGRAINLKLKGDDFSKMAKTRLIPEFCCVVLNSVIRREEAVSTPNILSELLGKAREQKKKKKTVGFCFPKCQRLLK